MKFISKQDFYMDKNAGGYKAFTKLKEYEGYEINDEEIQVVNDKFESHIMNKEVFFTEEEYKAFLWNEELKEVIEE